MSEEPGFPCFIEVQVAVSGPAKYREELYSEICKAVNLKDAPNGINSTCGRKVIKVHFTDDDFIQCCSFRWQTPRTFSEYLGIDFTKASTILERLEKSGQLVSRQRKYAGVWFTEYRDPVMCSTNWCTSTKKMIWMEKDVLAKLKKDLQLQLKHKALNDWYGMDSFYPVLGGNFYVESEKDRIVSLEINDENNPCIMGMLSVGLGKDMRGHEIRSMRGLPDLHKYEENPEGLTLILKGGKELYVVGKDAEVAE